MWRIRKNSINGDIISNQALRNAIDYECGTHLKTYRSNRKALIRLGWIKSYKSGHIILTDKDIVGEI